MEKWESQVRQLLAKARANAKSAIFSGQTAANDDGQAVSFDISAADVDGTLTRTDRALLIADIIRIAAEDGRNDIVASSLRTSGVPSLAHASDDDLIDLFVYLDHELRVEAM